MSRFVTRVEEFVTRLRIVNFERRIIFRKGISNVENDSRRKMKIGEEMRENNGSSYKYYKRNVIFLHREKTLLRRFFYVEYVTKYHLTVSLIYNVGKWSCIVSLIQTTSFRIANALVIVPDSPIFTDTCFVLFGLQSGRIAICKDPVNFLNSLLSERQRIARFLAQLQSGMYN